MSNFSEADSECGIRFINPDSEATLMFKKFRGQDVDTLNHNMNRHLYTVSEESRSWYFKLKERAMPIAVGIIASVSIAYLSKSGESSTSSQKGLEKAVETRPASQPSTKPYQNSQT